MLRPLGQRIKDRRLELGLSKADIARAAKCSSSAVGQWEKGDTKNLKLGNLFAVADALRMSARELATGAPEAVASNTTLTPEEIELVEKYRASSARWRLSLRLLAGVPDQDQNEVSESVNVLMAKIFAKPAADARVEAAYGRPPALHQARAHYAAARKKNKA